jgi:pSer/pThr/pTyr-binding forkhead associated (FHA) protein
VDDQNQHPDNSSDPQLPDRPEGADKNATIRTNSYTTRKPADLPSNLYVEQAGTVEDWVDTISILIPGNEKPTIFSERETVIIGRRDDPLNFHPDVDLTANYGVLMGVSRKHAEISLKNGQCFIQDLHSSNGTWLNEKKLVSGNTYPLHNGDQVRLGQLLLLVYLSSKKDGQAPSLGSSEDLRNMITIHMADKTETARLLADGMAPSYLSDTLGVYLRAIAALQRTIRQAQEQPAPPVMIRRIQLNSTKRIIEVDLLNANDIVLFLHEKLPGFLAQTQQEAASLESTTVSAGEDGEKQKASPDELSKQVADYMLSELVFKFLKDKRESYIERLSKILIPVLKSQLRMAAAIPAK